MMDIVRFENILSVKINGEQSHEELLTYIQEKQEVAPIRQLNCDIHVPATQLSVRHPLYSFIQSTTTLEQVQFSGFGGEQASIDAFLDAIFQNHSIHSVWLFQIDCSAYAIQKLMERKMKWEVHLCRVIGHPSSHNESTSYVEELRIQTNHISVMDFMASFRSWPFLCQLSIGIPLDLQVVHFLEHIIPAASILQKLKLYYIYFDDPDILQSFSTLVFNAPSPDLKCHLDDCVFYPNTMAVLENIVKSEKAKSMRIKFTLCKYLNGTHNHQVLPTILSDSSRIGHLDISDQHGDSLMDILPLLRQQQPFPTECYPCTSIHLTIHTDSLERYRDIIESIQQWKPCVKKLFLRFAFYGRPNRPFFRTELIQAVRHNMHLQLVELDVENVKTYDDENTKNADEQCSAWLERYCERNKKLDATLDKADYSIRLNVWPYVLHLVARGGADMLYGHLRQNAGYVLNGWHSLPTTTTQTARGSLDLQKPCHHKSRKAKNAIAHIKQGLFSFYRRRNPLFSSVNK